MKITILVGIILLLMAFIYLLRKHNITEGFSATSVEVILPVAVFQAGSNTYVTNINGINNTQVTFLSNYITYNFFPFILTGLPGVVMATTAEINDYKNKYGGTITTDASVPKTDGNGLYYLKMPFNTYIAAVLAYPINTTNGVIKSTFTSFRTLYYPGGVLYLNQVGPQRIIPVPLYVANTAENELYTINGPDDSSQQFTYAEGIAL